MTFRNRFAAAGNDLGAGRYWWSMIFYESRCLSPIGVEDMLFGIMLYRRKIPPKVPRTIARPTELPIDPPMDLPMLEATWPAS